MGALMRRQRRLQSQHQRHISHSRQIRLGRINKQTTLKTLPFFIMNLKHEF